MKNQIFKINSAQSSIAWVGRKVTGSHNGTISIKEGTLLFKEHQLVGGRIIVDTRSIQILDIADPATNAQFAGHLASDDFFSSERFPEAILDITSVEGSNVHGTLTIKGITQPTHLYAKISSVGETINATATLQVDRTKYNMKFRSGNFFQNLGDNLIYDEFDLSVGITATVAKSVSPVTI